MHYYYNTIQYTIHIHNERWLWLYGGGGSRHVAPTFLRPRMCHPSRGSRHVSLPPLSASIPAARAGHAAQQRGDTCGDVIGRLGVGFHMGGVRSAHLIRHVRALRKRTTASIAASAHGPWAHLMIETSPAPPYVFSVDVYHTIHVRTKLNQVEASDIQIKYI